MLIVTKAAINASFSTKWLQTILKFINSNKNLNAESREIFKIFYKLALSGSIYNFLILFKIIWCPRVWKRIVLPPETSTVNLKTNLRCLSGSSSVFQTPGPCNRNWKLWKLWFVLVNSFEWLGVLWTWFVSGTLASVSPVVPGGEDGSGWWLVSVCCEPPYRLNTKTPHSPGIINYI